MIFETKRLVVRKLTKDDFLPFHEMQNNPKVLKFVIGRGYTEEENRKQLVGCIDKYSIPDNDFWVWAIIRKSDNEFIGTCAVIGDEDEKSNEIGYRFLEKYWGNGYGNEICNELLDYCIDILKMKSVFATVDVRNIGSVKILDKSRLKFVKEFLNEERVLDRYYKFEN